MAIEKSSLICPIIIPIGEEKKIKKYFDFIFVCLYFNKKRERRIKR